MTAEWLNDIIYLLPIGGLIWHAAYMHSDVQHLKSECQELAEMIAKGREQYEKESKEMLDVIKHNKVIADDVLKEVNAALGDIRVAVARIETKLEGRKCDA